MVTDASGTRLGLVGMLLMVTPEIAARNRWNRKQILHATRSANNGKECRWEEHRENGTLISKC